MKKILLFISSSVVTLFTLAYAGAFHEYVRNCDMASVKKFIDNGVDINSLDDSKEPPLYHALIAGGCGKGVQGDKKRYELVKLLVDNGADVTLGEWFPAYFGAYNCNTYANKCYDLFVEKGADLNNSYKQFNNVGFTDLTPLTHIFFFNSYNWKRNNISSMPAIKYLLGKGVEVNSIIDFGSHGGKKSILDIAFEVGNFELINLLKKYGAKKRIDIEINNMNNE